MPLRFSTRITIPPYSQVAARYPCDGGWPSRPPVEPPIPDLYCVKILVIGNSTTYRPSRTATISDNHSFSVAKAESVRNEKRSSPAEIWKITERKRTIPGILLSGPLLQRASRLSPAVDDAPTLQNKGTSARHQWRHRRRPSRPGSWS
jgi:hypothetical protein